LQNKREQKRHGELRQMETNSILHCFFNNRINK
jgi:hypothetical protein